MSFAADSAIRADGPDRWSATIRPGWDIGGHANGGYLMTMATRAALAATERPDPVTVTAHFLNPGSAGPISIETATLKRGKTFATARASVWADETRLLEQIVTTGDVGHPHGPERVEAGPPDLPPPDECPSLVATDTFPPPFAGKVEMRLHPDDAGFFDGEPSGAARVRGWFRLRDDEPIDTVALVLAVDSFPPTIFNARLPVAWTPTVELTAHVRARPAPGWLRCAFTTRFVTGGFLEEDGEVWDASDRLVAQSRQLALIPRTRPEG